MPGGDLLLPGEVIEWCGPLFIMSVSIHLCMSYLFINADDLNATKNVEMAIASKGQIWTVIDAIGTF